MRAQILPIGIRQNKTIFKDINLNEVHLLKISSQMKFRITKGFTLLEILVVLIIVGIIVSSVTAFVSTDSPAQVMDKAVDKFMVFSDHATETALISGETVGLIALPPQWREDSFTQGWAYQWQKETAQGWVDMPELAPVEIPLEVELIILLEGKEWSWEKAPEIRLPIIAFYPSGEVTPFEIEFVHTESDVSSQHVLIDEWGELVWKEQEEAREEAEQGF